MLGPDDDEYNDGWVTPESRITEQLNTACDLLQSPHIRYLLYYQYNTGKVIISLEEAVEAVQEYEAADAEKDELSSRQSVRTSLVQRHLPRLAAEGVLDHDPRNGDILFQGHSPLEDWTERVYQLEFA